MANLKNIVSVAAYLANGNRCEWIFFTNGNYLDCFHKLERKMKRRWWNINKFTYTDDFDITMSVAIPYVTHISMMAFKDSHWRRIDTEDTQEFILRQYKNELFGEPKVGFGNKS